MITYDDFVAIKGNKPIYVILPDFEKRTFYPDIYESQITPTGEWQDTIGRVGGHYYNARRCFLTKKEAKEFARNELNRLLEEYK